MNKAGQLFSIFTTEEISFLLDNLNKLPNQKNSGNLFLAYTNGFESTDFIYPMIKRMVIEKLEQVIGKQLNLTHGMILKEQLPWEIHTDYVKGDNNPGMALLIPLITEEVNTHTVVFNEECITNFDQFILSNSKLENNAKDLYNNLCNHETIDRLEYVSLFGAYKWIPGSVIYWDRKLLHCSDNFLQNGLKIKIGLVLFTHD